MTDRIVTVDHRRRLLVARHLLGDVDRSQVPVEDVAEALVLLHSTDPSTPYLSIHARSDASIADIDSAFYERCSLSRSTAVRRTVFAMTPAMLRVACGAFNPSLVVKLRSQLMKWLEAGDEVTESPASFLRRAERLVTEYLSAVSSATGMALANEVRELRIMIDPMPDSAKSKPIRVTSKLLEIMAAEGTIVRGQPTGTDFTSGTWTWMLAATPGGWMVDAPDPDEALAQLLYRYLSTFGPATVTDMAWWTGLSKRRVRSALVQQGTVAVRLGVDDEPGFVAAGDELEASFTGPSVALLPGLDSTTMGWKQRSWYVDDASATGIFDRNGNAGPTIWVDGCVGGVWTQRSDGSIVTELFDDPGSDVRALVDAEAHRLAAWLGEVRVKWRYPTPITKRLAG